LLPFIVVQFILLVFFYPESSYNREHIYNIDTSSATDLNRLGEVEGRARTRAHDESDPEKDVPTARVPTTASGYRSPPPRKTFIQRMAPWSGIYSSDSIFKMVLASVVIMTNIGASWVIFISGLLVAWYVAIAVVSAQLFYAPPYLFHAASVGYTSTGPLLGGIIGATFTSIVMDPMLKFFTRRNKGV
jgi:hypothetical protein